MDGVSYDAYLGDQVNYNNVFISTIAAAIGTSTQYVKNLQVASTARRLTHARGESYLRAGSQRAMAADAVGLQYTVQVPASSGMTYDFMSSQLTSSVETNQFTDLLHQYASDQNVPALTAASSSSVSTQDTTPAGSSSGGDKSALGVGAIVGIVIGGVTAVLLIAFIAVYLRGRTPNPDTSAGEH